MVYAIYRNPTTGAVLGFIEDEDDVPVSYESQEAADEALRDYMLESVIEYVEL